MTARAIQFADRTMQARSATSLPSLFTAQPEARKRMRDFFSSHIRNKNTRRAYMEAVRQFSAFCARHGIVDLAQVEPVHVAAFVEDQLRQCSKPTVKQRLAALMPPGPWFYPADQSADIPARLLAAEVTREKVYLRVHEELPYAAAVETTAFEERRDGSARIEQTIYVERDGQRGILLGKGGETLKWIGKASREELSELLDRPVHLFLHVKVKATWAEDRGFYSDMGLDFDV